jgi:glycosyltransferase involved in cell wall biosynthesis
MHTVMNPTESSWRGGAASSSPGATARATIAVVPRERFSLAVGSLQSILRNTEQPVPIVYIDGRSPSDVARFIREQAQATGFRHLRFDHYLAPNAARNIAVEHVETEFVAFVDNDVIVQPGWLEKLVRCADETGAWAVGPLYLEGGPADAHIHMAGGFARIEIEGARRYVVEGHFHPQEKLVDVARSLRRCPTELLEFHAMLIRTDVFLRLGKLDERLRSIHEHVDLCLNVRAAGGSLAFEPEAVVRYSFEGALRLSDLPYAALRWSDDWTASSLATFKQKWMLCDEDMSIDGAIRFGRKHRLMLLGRYLPRKLRQSRFGPRAVRVLDEVACAFGRMRQKRRSMDGLGAMMPSDPGLVSVPRPASPAV